MRFEQQGNRLMILAGNSQLWIDPWGEDGVRVRMSCEPEMDGHDWALTEPVKETRPEIRFEEVDTTDPWYRGPEWAKYHQTGTRITFTNGKLTVRVSPDGWLSFCNQKGELLTEEYWRNRNRLNRFASSLRISARKLKPIPGTSDYALTALFEAFPGEKIFGMGQYQDLRLDKKGSVLELCHRNSQASVPFYVSSRGYGFLWNNPAVGQAVFGENRTEWTARSTRKMDYYITCGDTPADIERNYSAVTGRTPMMPEYGMGYWQCKLRYRTQEELMKVAREHKRRGLPMDAIVVDFFHWTRQGDYKFEPLDWPDPDAMVKELREMGIETVVSVWPTVDEKSENYGTMADRGYLVRTDRGNDVSTWMGAAVYFDATNPGTQKFVWEKCRDNYYRKGIRCFWLDEAEPEYADYELGEGHPFPGPLRLGGKPEIRGADLERGRLLLLPLHAGAAAGRAFHGHGGDSLVDLRPGRLHRRGRIRSGLPGAAGPLVRVGMLPAGLPDARGTLPLVRAGAGIPQRRAPADLRTGQRGLELRGGEHPDPEPVPLHPGEAAALHPRADAGRPRDRRAGDAAAVL